MLFDSRMFARSTRIRVDVVLLGDAGRVPEMVAVDNITPSRCHRFRISGLFPSRVHDSHDMRHAQDGVERLITQSYAADNAKFTNLIAEIYVR